ncbi:MAG: Uma2 family endonuclease [Candidatus Contendobacter sp.]|nr:Uma2 family endonuclease [Candidatus Contendobacter sp.]MDS4060036.1 Uma2 family endonuclease [Candidatus Contendobacter sp.]
MSATARKLATYEDLFDLPENLVGEIIHGQLITHPRPAPKHAVASSAIGDELVGPFQKGRGGPGGWWILDEPALHLGPHILVPDLAGWRRERLPSMPDTAFFTLPPDWVCEVLSPGTARVDRADKMPIYAAQEIPFLWLIDPAPRTLEVFALREGRWSLEHVYQQDDEVRAVPFDAIAFPLADLWC